MTKNICVKRLKYTSAARTTFQAVLENLEFREKQKLLLPAYLGITNREGPGVFDSLRLRIRLIPFFALQTGGLISNLYISN